jgi:16S rRNA C967 or C1407 C5-methylase (RsmB/RsmF family)
MEEYMPDSLKDRSKKGYMTLLQGVDECDGFFISRMIKK